MIAKTELMLGLLNAEVGRYRALILKQKITKSTKFNRPFRHSQAIDIMENALLKQQNELSKRINKRMIKSGKKKESNKIKRCVKREMDNLF